MSLREDLINSAVEFLKDPSISDSPLNKRIEFIESKGLTLDEIQELLKRAQQQQSQSSSLQAANNNTTALPQSNLVNAQDYYPNPPPIPERDWKDYFIMATTTVGVTYGLYQIVTRYVLPNILPPSKSQLEQEKESIDQEFSRIEKLLESLESRQDEFIEENNLKSQKIDDTLTSIDNIILKTNEKNILNEESLKYLKLEIENIKTTMITTLDSQKSTVLQELTNLETELNDLKKVLLQSDLKFPEKSDVALKPEEKLERFKIPPASAVPSANEILATTTTKQNDDTPDWQKYADTVQREQLNDSTTSTSKTQVPAWQQTAASISTTSPPPPPLDSSNDADEGASSTQGIPAWQLRS